MTPQDEAHIKALEEENRRMREALEQSVIAIDDWLHQYASEFCDMLSVEDTKRRISQKGGTLAYIADVQSANRAALKVAQS